MGDDRWAGITRGGAGRREHKRLQIFEPIAHTAAHFDEARAAAAIAPALERFDGHLEEHGDLVFGQERGQARLWSRAPGGTFGTRPAPRAKRLPHATLARLRGKKKRRAKIA